MIHLTDSSEDLESLSSYHTANFWQRRTATQKGVILFLVVVILVGVAVSSILASRRRTKDSQSSSVTNDPLICNTPECVITDSQSSSVTNDPLICNTPECVITDSQSSSVTNDPLICNTPECVITDSQSSSVTNDSLICNTPECVITAARLLSSVDTTVDPCDDFFSFCCGGWIKNSFLVGNAVSRFTKLRSNVLLRIRELLTNQKYIAPSNHWLKTETFYNSCMNIFAREKAKGQPLLDDLAAFGGWPLLLGTSWNASAFNWTQVLALMFDKGYNANIFASIQVVTDLENASATRLMVDQPKFGIPNRNYFLLEAEDNYVLKFYLRYILECALILKPDLNVRAALLEVKAAVEIEAQLAKASLSSSETKNPYKLYRMREIEELAPQVPWRTLFASFLPEGTAIGEEEGMLVPEPDLIIAFNELIKKSDPNGLRNLANYMMYRVVLTAAHDLNNAFRTASYDFHNIFTKKYFSYPDMWEQCIDITSFFFSYSVVSSYTRTYFTEENRVHMNEMLNNIRETMKEFVGRAKWMDLATRKKALEKVNKMNSVIGCPEEVLNDEVLNDFYSQLELDENYFRNARQMFRFFTHQQMQGLHETVDRSRWDHNSHLLVANAYYFPSRNEIIIPVGVLQEGIFDAGKPKYMNYGSLGMFIGHEVTHGFDNRGDEFDEYGDWKPWLDYESEERFEEMSECLVDQYNQYEETSINKKVNGTLTLGENIADNGGLRLAYEAYQKWMSGRTQEQLLPGLSFSPNQLFWISFGSVWCSKQTERSLRKSMLDVHTPQNLRVRGVLSNFEEFSRDFQCKAGTPMNPLKKCSVWT